MRKLNGAVKRRCTGDAIDCTPLVCTVARLVEFSRGGQMQKVPGRLLVAGWTGGDVQVSKLPSHRCKKKNKETLRSDEPMG